ncbi:hypothetical protein SXCC_02761 [Gluconacetobacter sp. SXCC-1]|uniref:nucleoside hydrolase n=1 Tax=Komagataeibacter rhaeticus TaxID=215221 RepID=UPI000207F866|nr:nucleoside hydrolase [Komagataeibacter rhaeticus]ATU74296.1 nucleoside hydrolase [Komagataeibacter xylinus]EGG76514.1 hypothetical protein SXCC_02761 [Gluconacetobacter sp. SXCC-1]WPP22549.1 nucleoside hydrolase [Komagataeibacter rhaeticus]
MSFFSSRNARYRLCGLFLALALACGMPVCSGLAAENRKVIIDDDDSLSLAEATLLKAPGVDVLGITVASGNRWRDDEINRMLRGLEILHRTDVPVVPGAIYPLINSEKLTEKWESLYGRLIWKGAWMKQWVEPTNQPAPNYHAPDVVPTPADGNATTKPSKEIAANFLIRMVHAYPGQVTILAAGAMTNLALAQRLDPEFASLAKELVYMGGSLNPHQQLSTVAAGQYAREFVNSPRREFNLRFDPEAASIVMHAPWHKITMVPSDPATATELSADFLHRIASRNADISRLVAHWQPGSPMWDEIAATVWLNPQIVTRSDQLYVDINTQFGAGYGDTLSWSPGYQPDLDEQKETVVETINPTALLATMEQILGRP